MGGYLFYCYSRCSAVINRKMMQKSHTHVTRHTSFIILNVGYIRMCIRAYDVHTTKKNNMDGRSNFLFFYFFSSIESRYYYVCRFITCSSCCFLVVYIPYTHTHTHTPHTSSKLLYLIHLASKIHTCCLSIRIHIGSD